MDTDSSSKFIGSLTKFLQSLCNGYVEFNRGVELVGHIYLNIDTGEKVDYILHEKVSKNDENSVTFVSNSFHAQPLDKEKAENKDNPSKSGASSKGRKDSEDDDDDIMIVDQSNSKGVPGSTNSGSIPSRGVKRLGSPNFSDRQNQRIRGSGGFSSGINRGSSNFQQNNRQHSGPSATVTSQHQEGIDIGDVKLEQISKDELMSLASQVNDGGGSRPSHTASSTPVSSHSRSGMWIKQEAADDDNDGGNEGWSHGREDSNSNSGSNLYPVMLHQNPAAYSSGSAFPGFSGAGPSGSQSGANLYGDPLPGTSQDSSGLDPSVWFARHAAVSYIGAGGFPSHPLNFARSRFTQQTSEGVLEGGVGERGGGVGDSLKSSTLSMRRYRQKLKDNPERRQEYRQRQLAHQKRYMARKKQRIMAVASAVAQYSSAHHTQSLAFLMDSAQAQAFVGNSSQAQAFMGSPSHSSSQAQAFMGSPSHSSSQADLVSRAQYELAVSRSQSEALSSSRKDPQSDEALAGAETSGPSLDS